MAVVYGEIDCLSKLTSMLRGEAKNIKSFEQLLDYRRECDKKVYEAELVAKTEISQKIQSLEQAVTNHLLGKSKLNDPGFFLVKGYRVFIFKIKLFRIDRQLKRFVKNSPELIRVRTESISGDFFWNKQVFDSNFNLIQGASGEQQALDELRKLPDSFYVVNNVQISFSRPLYEPRSNQRIYSIQADHVVVAPSGIFLIETKNWSRGTENLNYGFSAFDQIKRTNFALYCYFNPVSRSIFSFFAKTKKIKIRSILLMTGYKAEGTDQHVKVLSLNQLRGYIEYFKDELNNKEIQDVLRKLVGR